MEEMRSQIQASDAEFARGLKEKHILVIGNRLRPIAPAYLNTILELLLNTVVSLSLPLDAAPATDLADTLSTDHDISVNVSMQVMSWFGELENWSLNRPNLDAIWSMDEKAVVRQLGLGLLSSYRVCFPVFSVDRISYTDRLAEQFDPRG